MDSDTTVTEETEQVEPEVDVPVAVTFSLRRSAANDCAHKNTTFVKDSREDYWYYLHTNKSQHVANYYVGNKCDDCGVMVSQVRDYFAEDHVMNENSICTLCGYGAEEGSCAHSEKDVAWDTKQTVTYTQINDTQHKVTGYQYLYCTSCHAHVGESFAAEEYEEHTLDASGNCSLCGYVPDENVGCEHKNTQVLFYDKNPVRYAQFDEECHHVYRKGTIFCHDCRTDIGDSNSELTSLESHTLNDAGSCAYCGYGCGENYCTHPATDVMWDTSLGLTYTSVNEKKHEVAGYQYHYCTSCCKRISESFSLKELEDHDLDSAGDCTLCDYRVGCTHSETTKKLYSTLYESQSRSSHEVTRLYSKVCADPDCGKVLVSVETSYTETDVEDHVFDGNSCRLCNYTVADQLSATVSTSGVTANKGDNISATVSVIGGTGGYRFSWKILKDGFVVSEKPISTSASCDTVAGEEGSFVFQVTVMDSSGNTVTAQSGAITVKHRCQYKTVTDTVLVIESSTQHSVQTTTYEECTACHEKVNKQTSVDWVAHTPADANSYAHEAAHPHKKYFICECGAHPYLEDQFHTANGEVQEPDVCCVCHGHAFGDPAAGDDGNFYKTCQNCHLKQLVTVSAEPEDEVEETHQHRYTTDSSKAQAHPHPYTAKCACGASETYYKWDFTCCQCTGNHVWSFVRLTDGKTYMQVCSECGTTQSATPTAQAQDYYKVIDMITYRYNVAKRYQDEHNVDSNAAAIWKTIADQATEKLMDADFVAMYETLNTISKYGGIVGACEAVYDTLTKEAWDEQQTELWETLLLRMLTEYYENDLDPAVEYKNDSKAALKVVKKVSEKAGEKLTDDATYAAVNEVISEIDDWINMLENQITISYNNGNNLDALADQEKLEKLKALKKKYDDSIKDSKEVGAELNKAAKNVGLLMDCIDVLADGTSAALAVAERNDAFAEMLIHSDQCLAILKKVQEDASASGNRNLANAAEKLAEELEAEMIEQTNRFLSETGAFFKTTIKETVKIGIKKGAENLLKTLSEAEGAFGSGLKSAGDVLGAMKITGTAIKTVLDWGDAYDSAQKLMSVNQMDATMNITQVLKDNDSPYMLKLWGLLQAEGCERAQEFLNAWEDGTGLNSSDLGIDNGGLFGEGDLPKVLREIDVERNYYITALKLPLKKVNG